MAIVWASPTTLAPGCVPGVHCGGVARAELSSPARAQRGPLRARSMVGWRIHRLGASSTNSNPPKGRERGSSHRQALGYTPAPDGGGQWAAPGVLQVRPCLCCASARGVCGSSGMRLSWRRDVVIGRHDRGRGWRSAGSGVVRVFCSVFGPSRPPAGAAPKGGDVACHRRAAALSSMGPADESSVVSPCFVGRRVVLDGSLPQAIEWSAAATLRDALVG